MEGDLGEAALAGVAAGALARTLPGRGMVKKNAAAGRQEMRIDKFMDVLSEKFMRARAHEIFEQLLNRFVHAREPRRSDLSDIRLPK